MVAVKQYKDNKKREIVVAIELNQQEVFQEVNKITSVYGRNDFTSFFNRQLTNGKLLAVNMQKANDLLLSIEKMYLKENTIISFDDSIAYTFENVNIGFQ